MITYKLKDCIEEIIDRTTENNQYQVLSVTKEGIFSQEEIFKKQIASENNIGYKIIRKGNLVFSTMNLWMGSLDVLSNYEIGIVSPAYKIFSFNENNMLASFGKYFMKTQFMLEQYKNCSEQGASIVRRNLDLKQLLETEISIPTIEEQKIIVKVLENVDNVIKKYDDLIANKEQFIKSQFFNMFEKYFNEKKSVKLKELCDSMEDGDWIESKNQSTEGIRLIQTGNVGKGYYKDKKERYHFISEETFKRLHCNEIKPEDILVSRLPDPVGRMCIVPNNIGKAITAVDCTILRLKENINKEFLIQVSLTDYYLNQVESELSGSTRKRISRRKLEDIYIPMPPLEEQNKFCKIKQLLDKQKNELQKQKQNYINLKKGLIQQLLKEE